MTTITYKAYYSSQLQKKKKIWDDAILIYNTANMKAELYTVDDTHNQKSKIDTFTFKQEIQLGEEYRLNKYVVTVDSPISNTIVPSAPIKSPKKQKFEVQKSKNTEKTKEKIEGNHAEDSGIVLSSEYETTISLLQKPKTYCTTEESKSLDFSKLLAIKRKAIEIKDTNKWIFLQKIKTLTTFDDIDIDFTILSTQSPPIPNFFASKEEYCLCFLQSLYRNLMANCKEAINRIDCDSMLNVKLIGSLESSVDPNEDSLKSISCLVYIKALTPIPDKIKKETSCNDLWVLCADNKSPICYARSTWYSFSSQHMLQVIILGNKPSKDAIKSISHAFMAISLSSYMIAFQSILRFQNDPQNEQNLILSDILHIKFQSQVKPKQGTKAVLTLSEIHDSINKILKECPLNNDQSQYKG